MYRIAICDDLDHDLQAMTATTAMVLTNAGVKHKIEQFHTAERLLDMHIRGESWNLILMDIMMEGQNGIQVAEALRGSGDETDLIFITSSPEYALAGYRAYPVSYLLKPLTRENLWPVLSRCLERRQALPSLVVDSLEGGKLVVPLAEIRYIEVFRRELVIHKGKQTQFCVGPLNAALAELPPEGFYRCHRSYVVNLNYVSGIQKYRFLLHDGADVPIAVRAYPEAQARWLDYLK